MVRTFEKGAYLVIAHDRFGRSVCFHFRTRLQVSPRICVGFLNNLMSLALASSPFEVYVSVAKPFLCLEIGYPEMLGQLLNRESPWKDEWPGDFNYERRFLSVCLFHRLVPECIIDFGAMFGRL